MTTDIDELKLQAKQLGIKGWHLMKEDTLLEEIDKATAPKAEEAKPEPKAKEPEPITSQPKPEEKPQMTPADEITLGDQTRVIVSKYIGGDFPHRIWVPRNRLAYYEAEGYKVVD